VVLHWIYVLTVSASSSMTQGATVEITIEDDDPSTQAEDDEELVIDAAGTAPPAGEATPVAAEGSDPPAPSAATPSEPPVGEDPGTVTDTHPQTSPELAEELRQLRERLEYLERKEDERAAKAAAKQAIADEQKRTRSKVEGRPSAVGVGFKPLSAGSDWGVRFGGYLQVQYLWSALSEDQLMQGGTPLNRNRFMVRRGRLTVEGEWKYIAAAFQLDASTTRGAFLGIRQAHVSALWRNPDASKPPYIMATVGLTEAPFGYEVRLGQREMIFMERSTGSLAFFPGPVDIGLRLRGGVGPFRYDVAVMNGAPLDDRAGSGANGLDPTTMPDFIGRFGVEVPASKYFVAAGASFLAGQGFHAGLDATKNQVQWQDINENGAIDTGELVSIPGTAATPSETFSRWAVNADVELGIRSRIGWSQLWAEVTLGSNLDRGLYVSDPVEVGSDLRQLQVYAALIQELTKWAIVGFRYDFYDPNTDLLDRRRGVFVPAQAGMHTFSPLAGAVLPENLAPGFRGRLVFQYDAILDALGRDSRGVPADVKNDQFTVRLQGEF